MAPVPLPEHAPASPAVAEGQERGLRAGRRLLQEMSVRAAVAVAILTFNEGFQLIVGTAPTFTMRVVPLLALVINVPYYLAATRGPYPRLQAYARMLVDIGFVTLGLRSVGGLAAAPYVGAYVVIPLYAGFALSSTACVVATVSATVAYVSMVLVLDGGWLVHLTGADTPDLTAALFNLLLVNLVGGVTGVLAAAYRRSRRQLVEANRDLERAHYRIVEAERVRAIGELSAGVAHHLNNLMAVVLGRIQLALRCADDSAHVNRNLEIAERGLLDASEVVRRMTALSVGQALPEVVPVDLNALIQEVIDLTRPRWESEAQMRGLAIEARLEPGRIVSVAGDPAGLREVLMNLIFNAIDALPQGGRILVRTWVDAEMVACSVSDNGVGMEAAVQQRATEPFFTTKGLRCTGLGLSVSYGIIHRHGGTLTIDSADGRGTTITFRLRPSASAPPAPPHAPPRTVAGRRILLIDDDAAVLGALGDMLTLEGHRVLSAGSGFDGLARLEAGQTVDLVLTDLSMPGMTGWDVARAVKSRYPALPVGLITGWGEEQRARFEEDKVADFVLGKPIRREALAAALAQWVPVDPDHQAKPRV